MMVIKLNQTQSDGIRDGFGCVMDYVFNRAHIDRSFKMKLGGSCVQDPSIYFQSNPVVIVRIVKKNCDTFQKMWDAIRCIDEGLRSDYPCQVNSFRMIVKVMWLEANRVNASFPYPDIISYNFHDCDVANIPLEIKFYGMCADSDSSATLREISANDYVLTEQSDSQSFR